MTAETISKNMGSLGDSSAENSGSLEPYICITSKMGVPPQEKFLLVELRESMLILVKENGKHTN